MNYAFVSLDELTSLSKSIGITSWNQLLLFIQKLPYGRNENRYDLSLVLKEQKGSCSSKHALLKAIAEENNIPNIQLILGIYKMNHTNTNVGSIILNNNLAYIPEAHCYLKINNDYIDITSTNTNFDKIKNTILVELEITPNQVSEFKVEYHKKYIQNWIVENNIQKSFDEVWSIREQCIAYLSKSNK